MKIELIHLPRALRCLACVALLCPSGLFAGVALDPWLATLPVVERITKAPVFEFPLVYVGDQPPDPTEANDLWAAIDVMRQNGPAVGIPLLEQFIEMYTNSVWIPSLHADLGDHYRNHGRYSLALNHWQAAWDETKTAPAGDAKSVADHALAHWTRLLASLGRKETLATVFQETQGRVLDAGPLQQIFEGTKEALGVMQVDPGVSYRCGTIALANVVKVLQPGNPNLATILNTSSPDTGFSLTALKDLADRFLLNLVAVQRLSSEDLIVPSLVHWKLDHYAAITGRNGNLYHIEDPTFEHAIWVDADTINAEASGYFLIPFNLKPLGWNFLNRLQTDQIFGRGIPFLFHDDDPEACPNDEAGDEAGDASNAATFAYPPDPSAECPTCNRSGAGGLGAGGFGGGSGGGCFFCSGGVSGGSRLSSAAGMPTWTVAEPNINLWLTDTPTFYTKSYGKRHAFRLMYKQRSSRANS